MDGAHLKLYRELAALRRRRERKALDDWHEENELGLSVAYDAAQPDVSYEEFVKQEYKKHYATQWEVRYGRMQRYP